MRTFFRKFASYTSQTVGSPLAFIFAFCSILIWIFSGPFFNYSNTWQLVINTATTIITFLMVFLIQNTQNRDAKATHVKLDELIKATKGARNSVFNIENIDEKELDSLLEEFKVMREKYQKRIEKIKELKQDS